MYNDAAITSSLLFCMNQLKLMLNILDVLISDGCQATDVNFQLV